MARTYYVVVTDAPVVAPNDKAQTPRDTFGPFVTRDRAYEWAFGTDYAWRDAGVTFPDFVVNELFCPSEYPGE